MYATHFFAIAIVVSAVILPWLLLKLLVSYSIRKRKKLCRRIEELDADAEQNRRMHGVAPASPDDPQADPVILRSRVEDLAEAEDDLREYAKMYGMFAGWTMIIVALLYALATLI